MMKITDGCCEYYGRMKHFDWKVNIKNYIHLTNKYTHNTSSFTQNKVIVWGDIARAFVLGPYFFEKVTTTGAKLCSFTSDWYKSVF